MNILNIAGYEFITYSEGDAEIYFSTAKGNLNFNKNTQEGLKNIENLKKWFNLKDVGYLNQVHSNLVHIYDKKNIDGDALITNETNLAIGIFTADCVPIIVYDKKNKVSAAIHSGWKGTKSNITINTINKMKEDFGTCLKDLAIYIGPHNMKCCYEVSEELVNDFKNIELYKSKPIADGRYLSLQQCIVSQLDSLGIKESQIKNLNICTFCDEEYEMHSYRKDKESAGRMFSFIFIK